MQTCQYTKVEGVEIVVVQIWGGKSDILQSKMVKSVILQGKGDEKWHSTK